ncbi:MAG: alanine:cation symporter family protein [Lachnospiraceae bacterium]|nr:alanine:cation symporter family protein [Lachnospiraceae bacterium]
MELLSAIDNFLWSYPVAGLLLLAGAYYTVCLGFPQIRHFTRLLPTVLKGQKTKDGSVSGFSAFCATVGGQVGTGSLVGVASALAAGGPGAMFWMWVTALLGMAISFGEAVLGQVFRLKGEDGNYYGGAPYYMKQGLHNEVLATLYAITTVFAVGFCIAMIQNNSISSAVVEVVPVPKIIPGLFVGGIAALIVMGGVRRITDTASAIVPFMAGAYILITIAIVVMNMGQVPAMLADIFSSAFTGRAAAGGAVGYTMQQAFRNGVARGLFSNDAGNGGASAMHASAVVKHPGDQGLAAMLGTFITTILICSCTGFSILLTGAVSSGKDGINLVQAAFAATLGNAGNWIVLIAMILFGFTTLIADIFYGEASIRYLFKNDTERVVMGYKILAVVIVVMGSVLSLPLLWTLVDLCAAFLVFFNLVPLIALFSHVKHVLKDYDTQLRDGNKEPEWKENQI